MSDQDEEVEKPFAIERAKTCRAKCKKCKCPIDKDSVRIAKLMSNPFGDGKMKAWHHVTCIFDVFAKQRATTKRIEDPSEDVSGWDDLDDDDKAIVLEKLEEFENNAPYKKGTKKTIPTKKNVTPSPSPGKKNVTPSPSPGKKNVTPSPSPGKKNVTPSPSPAKDNSVNSTKRKLDNSASTSKQQKKMKKDAKAVASIIKDDAFCEFRGLCNELAHVSAYSAKTAIVKRMLTKGTEGDGFKSDVYLWCKLLLPGAVKRIYNLQSKQLVKLFARLFRQNENEMLEDLDKGDVAQTIKRFFEKSVLYKPNVKSLLTIQEVDAFLEELCQLTKEDDQENHFGTIIGRCTSDDLLMIIRLIKRDLRINAGPKHILEAVHSDAYQAYQVSNDLAAVIERCLGLKTSTKTSTSPTKILGDSKVALSLMTPVLPMLAEACKSVEMAMKKCPNGMLSEVKYDGERVQVHKHGAEFRYFSRSLKPVLPHKIKLFKDYIPKAFPDGDDLILDSEILMIDTTTGQPLPFGTLGKHKKQEFQDANVCLFVFDCLYYNGDVLLNKPMKERRSILEDRMTVIPNRIMLSEVQEVHDPKDLAQMIAKVLKMGLEGLVLKDMKSLYEPGKRHWLKVKKDYLLGGAMADSADLVVLGAWYGTGQKGGMMSVFLMGCYDSDTDLWYTVTKVHTGHDDATLARLQGELKMIKIGKDPKLVPDWLNVNRPMVPDFIAADPKKQPVWEITGAEFTNQGVHTADSISIRFPRVTRIRKDKNYRTATSLSELRDLFESSAESIDYLTLLGTDDGDKKKPTKLDAYLKPGPSGFSKSPSTSPSKKIKDERISDDESIESESDSEDRIQPNGNGETRIVSKATKGKNNAIFDGIRITFSDDLDKAKRQYLRTILQTNGAKVLTGRRISETTHVVHGTCELPATVLHDNPEVPKKARHVNYSWIEESLAESRILDVLPHAVKLLGVYCNCPCPH